MPMVAVSPSMRAHSWILLYFKSVRFRHDVSPSKLRCDRTATATTVAPARRPRMSTCTRVPISAKSLSRRAIAMPAFTVGEKVPLVTARSVAAVGIIDGVLFARDGALVHLEADKLLRAAGVTSARGTSRPMKSPLFVLTAQPTPDSSGPCSASSSARRGDRRLPGAARHARPGRRASRPPRSAVSQSAGRPPRGRRSRSRLRPCSRCARRGTALPAVSLSAKWKRLDVSQARAAGQTVQRADGLRPLHRKQGRLVAFVGQRRRREFVFAFSCSQAQSLSLQPALRTIR